MKNSILKDNTLLDLGFKKIILDLPNAFKRAVETRNWEALDQDAFKVCGKDGLIYKELKRFHEFTQVEHLINIRQGPGDEDGIWHDDGSRYLAFSLSLNFSPQEIAGGELFLRKKGDKNKIVTLSPLPYGEMIVFLTGQYNFEHKVGAVTAGERINLAGWCS
ncbi:MAG: 2OG-Fe(II) oxygenase [Deltaproteobacteria bacterium]|nr:MAG: 2OG-Fe(II) oxygenase [Deltaproteobacteria bacterium]